MGTKKERVYIRVTTGQKTKLQEMAKQDNRSLSNYILTVVESHIEREENMEAYKGAKYEIVYKDEEGEVIVAEYSGNRSHTVDQALEITGVDMDEFAEENDWDGWDWNCLEVRIKTEDIPKKYYLIKHENVRGGKKRTEIEEKNVTDYFDEYLTLSDTYKGMDDFASEKDFFEWLETKYDELFKRLEGGESLDTGDHDLILE